MIGAPDRRAGVIGLVRRLGSVQLDTISVLARSHELVAYSRLGPIGRPAVDAGLWGGDGFEYWAHAACVVPMDDWPWFAARRRRLATRWARVHDKKLERQVLARLRDGGASASDLGGAKVPGNWWSWSPVKRTLERMLAVGIVVCRTRKAWRRVYELAEDVVPPELLAREPSDDECHAELVRRSARHLGVGTMADIADYYRLLIGQVRPHLDQLTPVRVRGWDSPAWVDPEALETTVRGHHRSTLLSPFDPIVWDRDRVERLFGFRYRIEVYVPAPQREHGYYSMPLLHGGRLVGRVDPKRSGKTLVARHVLVESGAEAAMRTALEEAATWVGCDHVVTEG